jgi:hypothetical protein
VTDALDHDLLIGLRAELISVRQIIETHNIASVERDTRIETKVQQINGSVSRHDAALLTHAQVPHSGVAHADSALLVARLNEMWTAWSVGKWVGMAGVLALIGQTMATIMLVLRQ